MVRFFYVKYTKNVKFLTGSRSPHGLIYHPLRAKIPVSVWHCQMENKTKSRENKSHNILEVPNCNKGRTCFISIRHLLSYYPRIIKFLGITFENRMTFTKHFEEILERCSHKCHRLRILVNKSGVQVPQLFYKSTNNV